MSWAFRIQHQELLDDIRQLDCSPAFREANFTQVSYSDPEGGLQIMYRVKRDGFILLARKFSGEKAKQVLNAYIEAFNRVDENLRQLDNYNKNPFITMSPLDLMKIQASIEAERRILMRANH
jgi:Rha family phage regulatory protein